VFFAVGLGVLGTGVLWGLSRGKWSDAIIDSGREWIVPDALARGELLYRDVVYWFGPLTPYLHAAFFRVFGSGFPTLVLAGIVGSLGVLAALYFALRAVTPRREAILWTTLAIPALVFMPNGGGPILGMGYRIWHAAAFALGALAVALRRDGRPLAVAAAVGVLAGLSGLCRTEWGAVTVLSSLAIAALRSPDRRFWREALVTGGAFLLVVVGVLGGFIAAAGPDAVLYDGHLLLTGLPVETRAFLVAYSGIRDWASGLLELLYSTALWVGAVLLLQVVAIGRADKRRIARKLPLLAIVFFVLIATAALGGAGGAVIFSAGPLLCAGAVAASLLRRSPIRPALLGFGLAGTLFFYRRPFHIGDSAYVGPPLLFAVVCAAGLVQLLTDGERDVTTREHLRSQVGGAVLALAVVAFAGRAVQFAGDERIAVPGTGGMLSARPESVARLESLARAVGDEDPDGTTLVVFPEGEILNAMTGRPNPIRHKLYIPGYLTKDNEPQLLSELNDRPPSAVVVLYRPTSEYGPGTFGVTYGQGIRGWIEHNYGVRSIDPRPGRAARWEIIAVRKKDRGTERGRFPSGP
jgi:hypothetical protein